MAISDGLDWIGGDKRSRRRRRNRNGNGNGNGRSNPLPPKSDNTKMGDFCGLWSKLPEDMMEKIFTSLPLAALYNLRSVCKEWNAVFSSKEFVMFWNKILFDRSPWLVLCEDKQIIAYCISTRTWKTISLSFMVRPDENVSYKGSGCGLLLFCTASSRNNYKSTLWACNPLKRTAFQITARATLDRGSIFMEEDGSYKVLSVESDRFRIQDMFNEEDWITIYYPLELSSIDCVLIYKGFLCFMTYQDTPGIMFCSMSGVCTSLAPLPDTFPSSHCRRPFLFQYRSALLLVVAGSNVEGWKIVENVVVWQLEMDNVSWKEIARMPSSILEEFNTRFRWSHQFVILGDHLCGSGIKCEDAVICNLMEGSWTWVSLPKCHQQARDIESLNPLCSLGI